MPNKTFIGVSRGATRTIGAMMLIAAFGKDILGALQCMDYLQLHLHPVYDFLVSGKMRLVLLLFAIALFWASRRTKEPPKQEKVGESEPVRSPIGEREVQVYAAPQVPHVTISPTFNNSPVISPHIEQSPSIATNQTQNNAQTQPQPRTNIRCIRPRASLLSWGSFCTFGDETDAPPAGVAGIVTIVNDFTDEEAHGKEITVRATLIYRDENGNDKYRVPSGCWMRNYHQYATIKPSDSKDLVLLVAWPDKKNLSIYTNRTSSHFVLEPECQ